MPHYDPHTDMAGATELPTTASGAAPDEADLENAAEALRHAEVQAVQPTVDPRNIDAANLEHMNIDDLRLLAKELDVPDRATITEKDDLVAAIRRQL